MGVHEQLPALQATPKCGNAAAAPVGARNDSAENWADGRVPSCFKVQKSSRTARSIGGGVSALQWIVSAYTIAFAALILTTGALGDRVGAKKIFIAGFAIFTGASLACALVPTIGILIAEGTRFGEGLLYRTPLPPQGQGETWSYPIVR
jgi:MFS family permease